MGLLGVREGAFGVGALGGRRGEEGGGGVGGCGGLGVVEEGGCARCGAEEGGGLCGLVLVLVLVVESAEWTAALCWLVLSAAKDTPSLLLLVLVGIAPEETRALLLLRLRCGIASKHACGGRLVREETDTRSLVLGGIAAEDGAHLGRIVPVLVVIKDVCMAGWWYSRLRCERYVESEGRERVSVEEDRMRNNGSSLNAIVETSLGGCRRGFHALRHQPIGRSRLAPTSSSRPKQHHTSSSAIAPSQPPTWPAENPG